jgi:hypothetical protein
LRDENRGDGSGLLDPLSFAHTPALDTPPLVPNDQFPGTWGLRYGDLPRQGVVKLISQTGSRRPSILACAWPMLIALASCATLAGGFVARQGATAADEKRPDLKSFVGTWNGTFQGQVFATLVLRQEHGSLSGTLNNFDINVDKEGNLIEGTHKDDGDAPLLNVHFRSGAVYFTVLEKDQYRDGMSWKFVPINARQGELTPALEYQEDVPKDLVVKPIRMVRALPKP